MRRFICALAATLFLASGAQPAAGSSLRPIGEFAQPIYVTSSPANPDRLIVAERRGAVIEVTPGARNQIADIGGLISCCESERGLLSLAPAPDFESSGRFYVAYTGNASAGGAEGDVHLDSFRPDPAAPGQVVREPILGIGHASEPNHNGGQLQFGPDGHLYLSLGDGGGGGDPSGNAQDTEVLLGKILRIDPHPGGAPSYSIPAGNPFAFGAGRDEIWAYGLRNPWRFSFDRQTGDMVIADVGQDALEEIDFAASGGASPGAGLNYGWNCREGSIPYSGAPGGCPSTGFTDPVFEYPHDDPGGGAAFGCSIIGGYVVRDPSIPDLYGRYVYSDFCTGDIRSLVLPSGGPAGGDRFEGLEAAKPTSFGEDACGRVYVASDEGPVYRLEGPTPATCPAGGAVQPIRKHRQRRLLLSAKRLHRGSERFKVKVRLAPCAGEAGRRVRLKRNGKRYASKRLNRRCAARFRLRIDRRTSVRAVVRLGTDHDRLRSRRLVLAPTR